MPLLDTSLIELSTRHAGLVEGCQSTFRGPKAAPPDNAVAQSELAEAVQPEAAQSERPPDSPASRRARIRRAIR